MEPDDATIQETASAPESPQAATSEHAVLLAVRGLRVENLHITHLDIHAGECGAIAGASGSGKSLLLRALADLIPHQGDLYLDNQAQHRVAPNQWRKQLAYLAPKTLWWYPSVGEHFQKPDATLFKKLGFDMQCLNWPTSRLSSGEQQRLGLLRLLQNTPRILLLDEPSSHLDKQNTLLLEALVLDYLRDHNAGALWVSHDEQQLHRLAAKTYTLHEGALQ